MFFAASNEPAGGPYDLLIKATKFADEHDLTCVWTPERHFDRFGGMFPNPALTMAALAVQTSRVELRAGSLILPLHDPIRVAEELAVVDQLSRGRVAVSFGSGWNANDFVFFPDRYVDRQKIMYEQIDMVRRLWAGETIERINGAGRHVEIAVLPRPYQEEIPIWVTSSGHPDTFTSAGRIGANVLTHLIGQDTDQLASKIRLYREERRRAGHGEGGRVALMLHTFLGPDTASVRSLVEQPFREYLKAAADLEGRAAEGGGSISGGKRLGEEEISAEVMDELLDLTFERYVERASLFGTADTRRDFVAELRSIGVDEIACLVDFGLPDATILDGLGFLAEFAASFR